MAGVGVRPFRDGEDNGAWDAWVRSSWNGTMLHTRRYLDYHQNRFRDCSLWIEREGKTQAVFPAAVDPDRADRVISHPGLTYGGMVFGDELRGENAVDALAAIRTYYREAGFGLLRYKPVPAIYHRYPAESDHYALFRLDARCWRTDLCSAVDLTQPRAVSRERRWGIKKASGAGLDVVISADGAEELWPILEWQLETLHGVRPVHSLAEIVDLMARFPDHIRIVSARLHGVMVAGVVLFITDRVVRAQYSANSALGRELYALNVVFEEAVRFGQESGCHYLDFGNSNEADGRVLNAGLHRFKAGFGAKDIVQMFYELSC